VAAEDQERAYNELLKQEVELQKAAAAAAQAAEQEIARASAAATEAEMQQARRRLIQLIVSKSIRNPLLPSCRAAVSVLSFNFSYPLKWAPFSCHGS